MLPPHMVPSMRRTMTKPCCAQGTLQSWWYERGLVVWASINYSSQHCKSGEGRENPWPGSAMWGRTEGCLGKIEIELDTNGKPPRLHSLELPGLKQTIVTILNFSTLASDWGIWHMDV